MHVDKAALSDHLHEEMSMLETALDSNTRQVSTFQTALGDTRLQGAAYDAMRSKIEGVEIPIAKAHYVALKNLYDADSQNLACAADLPDGVFNTGELASNAEDAQAAINAWNQTINLLKSPVSLAFGASPAALIAIANVQIENLQHVVDDNIDKLRRISLYMDAVASLYDGVQSDMSQEGIMGAATAAAIAVSAGQAPDMSWAEGQNDRYASSLSLQHRLMQVKPYLSEAEYAAYIQAFVDGKISSDELYNEDSNGVWVFNEALYSGLAKLPSDLVDDDAIGVVCDAVNHMCDVHDAASLERIIELSYIATGEVEETAPPNMDYGSSGNDMALTTDSMFPNVTGATDGIRAKYKTKNVLTWGEVAEIGAIVAVFVLLVIDDVSGAGVIDDPLMGPLLMRLGVIMEQAPSRVPAFSSSITQELGTVGCACPALG